MEAEIPFIMNFVAILIALLGVYQSAVRDYEKQRDEARELRQQLYDCRRENQLLRETLQGGRSGGINISGGAVTIGKDAVAGDENIGRDAVSGNVPKREESSKREES
jgi:hypothetical protein